MTLPHLVTGKLSPLARRVQSGKRRDIRYEIFYDPTPPYAYYQRTGAFYVAVVYSPLRDPWGEEAEAIAHERTVEGAVNKADDYIKRLWEYEHRRPQWERRVDRMKQRREASENPLPTLTQNQKIGVAVVGGLGALLVGYGLYAAGKSAGKVVTPTPAPPSSLPVSSPSPVVVVNPPAPLPPPQHLPPPIIPVTPVPHSSAPTGGTWTPATTLTQGKYYRASADVKQLLNAQGFSIYTEHDGIPIGWPTDDTDAARWRAEGLWAYTTQPIPAATMNQYGLKLYEHQP